jgi:hypothetical protein
MNGSRINRRNLIGAAALIATGLSTRAHSVSQGASNRISRPTSKIKGAVILYDGATLIDFAGPWKTFQDVDAGQHPGFELYTVASRKTIQTTGNSSAAGITGLTLTVEYVFPDAPQPNVIVMGAQSGRSNPVIVHQDSPEPITTFVIPVLKYSDGAAARKHDH